MTKLNEQNKKQFAILKGKGFTQKEIAKELGITEKTATNWAKQLPINDLYTIRDGMQKRLVKLVKDDNTPIVELYNLSNTLEAMNKRIDKYTSITPV